MLTRRDFLGGAAAGLSAPFLLNRGPTSPFRAHGVARHGPAVGAGDLTFDLHCHPGAFFGRGGPGYSGDEATVARIAEMVSGGMSGGFFSLVSDMKILAVTETGVRPVRAYETGEAWGEYERQLSDVRSIVSAAPADLVRDRSGVEAAVAERRVGVFLACEGGDCLEGEPDRLARLYRDGVRSIQLVHYAQNDLGDLQTEPAVYGGLSSIGRDVVREMNALGMVIDVAHASFETAAHVIETSEAPIVLSHSQLKHGENQHPRLLEPEHALLVAESGGVIGMWPSGFGNTSLEDFVENTLRMVDLVGIDHVGLGTDMDGNYRPVIGNYREVPDWLSGLSARGLSNGDVSKLGGGNAYRVLAEVFA